MMIAGWVVVIVLFGWLTGTLAIWFWIYAGIGIVCAVLYVVRAVEQRAKRDIKPEQSARRNTAFQIVLAAVLLGAFIVGSKACDALNTVVP
jgi:phosphatidylglycerophosphate synthase